MSLRGSWLAVLSLPLAMVPAPAAYDFGPWPAGTSPGEVGRRVAENFVPRPHLAQWEDTVIHYAEACTWYGALTFARLDQNAPLQAQLVERFEPLFREQRDLVPDPDHVDWTVFAAVPLEIYQQNQDRRCLAPGEWMAQRQWGEPYGRPSLPSPNPHPGSP